MTADPDRRGDRLRDPRLRWVPRLRPRSPGAVSESDVSSMVPISRAWPHARENLNVTHTSFFSTTVLTTSWVELPCGVGPTPRPRPQSADLPTYAKRPTMDFVKISEGMGVCRHGASTGGTRQRSPARLLRRTRSSLMRGAIGVRHAGLWPVWGLMGSAVRVKPLRSSGQVIEEPPQGSEVRPTSGLDAVLPCRRQYATSPRLFRLSRSRTWRTR